MANTSQILILGGTGRIGKLFITDALDNDYHITALVRKPDSIPPHENLTLVTGSPTSTQDIIKALTTIAESSSNSTTKPGVTIVSTLGQTRTNPSNPWSAITSPAMFMSQAAQAVVNAIRNIETTGLNVKIDKFLVLSAFGTGDSWPYMHWSLRWVMAHSNMRPMIEDHNKIIEIVQENLGGDGSKSDGKLYVPFVVVRPVMLKFDQTGEIPAVKEYGHGREGMGVMMGCDVRSLSRFLVERVADGRLDGTMPVIST